MFRYRQRLFGSIGCAMILMANNLAPQPSAAYDRPAGDPHGSRSPVVAQHGIVATSQPLAAQAGLAILQRGGNAADAAIAANAMIGLTEPMSCGIGGDLFALYWDAKTQKLYGLNASGRSPYALSRDEFKRRGLERIPSDGPLSWSVPGCVSGWEELRARFGTLPLADLLETAIRAADDGFPVSPLIGAYWQLATPDLKRWPTSSETYLPGGRAPRPGETFRNPRLAACYRQIAEGGAAAFYRGSIADEIVAFSRENGGFFERRDFAEHSAEWVDPITTNYRGYDVWELPPNGQGLSVLQMLNLLEPYDLKAMGMASADLVHLLIEVKKLAYADRSKYIADPAAGPLPVAELLSKRYAERRRARIDMQKASIDQTPGNPLTEAGDTIYLTVVDKDRNCCSLIQSNFHGFGSGVVPGQVGFAMQNRGALFALDEAHVNRFEPHKRPFHTIIPGFVTREGKPFFSFGVMGGDMQPQGHVQVLVNLIDFGLDPQAAGDAARVRHLGSPEPTGAPADDDGGTVVVESGISDDVVEELRRRGHNVRRGRGDFGGYQGIMIHPEFGSLWGGSEPRLDGAAVGY